jgi:hypothetical protein
MIRSIICFIKIALPVGATIFFQLSFAQNSFPSQLVGNWESGDGIRSIAIRENEIFSKFNTVANGKKETDTEKMRLGKLEIWNGVDEGRFAVDKREFRPSFLRKEYLAALNEARRNPHDYGVDKKNAQAVLAELEKMPAKQMRALRLADRDHCTDRSLMHADECNLLIFRANCKYGFELALLQSSKVNASFYSQTSSSTI